MDDKFKCKCMMHDSTYIEQMAAGIEIAILQVAPMACPKLALFGAARVAGSSATQVGGLTIEELRDEVMRQFDIGVAYAQQMMAEEAGQHVNH